jgi:hypothetical protein
LSHLDRSSLSSLPFLLFFILPLIPIGSPRPNPLFVDPLYPTS